MKIILSGGGTLGPVFPLLALAEKIKTAYPTAEFLWLGTAGGPERAVVEARGIKFKALAAGKWRRYFSWRNLSDLFLTKWGFWQALFLLVRQRPAMIISAGGFNSVPTVWAGWCLGIPCFIHQQDLQPGLANRLMAPLARKITVVFKEVAKFFPAKKTVWTGNPIRSELFQGQKQKVIEKFKLEPDLPTVLILGGGTGALGLNELVQQALPELTKFCQIIQMTGRGKTVGMVIPEGTRQCGCLESVGEQIPACAGMTNPRYHPLEFIGADLADVLAASEVVITRAGLSTLSELAALGKATVIVPMPNSHQEVNARYFAERGAALWWPQDELAAGEVTAPTDLTPCLRALLNNPSRLAQLRQNIAALLPADAADKWLEVLRPWMDK